MLRYEREIEELLAEIGAPRQQVSQPAVHPCNPRPQHVLLALGAVLVRMLAALTLRRGMGLVAGALLAWLGMFGPDAAVRLVVAMLGMVLLFLAARDVLTPGADEQGISGSPTTHDRESGWR